jgi:hypothetical protein
MSNGSDPSCPACDTKIILNGDVTARVLDATCERIDAFVSAGHKFPDAHKLVEMANGLEDAAFAFSKEVLSQMGFEGPWPHSMS